MMRYLVLVMSKLIQEAELILEKKNINVEDYKRFKEIGKKISEEEERNFAWLSEGIYLKIPQIIEKEKDLAYKARDFINNLIINSKEIKIITNYDRGSYGRILADIEIDQLNVSELLIKNNLGVLYDRNNKKNWCNKD